MKYKVSCLLIGFVWLLGCGQEPKPTVLEEKTVTVAYQWPAKVPIVSVVCKLSSLPNVPQTLVLESYYWDKFRPIAEYTIDGTAEVLHQFKGNYQVGLYRWILPEVKDARPVYFIVNGVNDRVDIEGAYADFVSGKATIKPDDEVFALNETIQLHRNKTQAEDSLKAALSNITAINPRYYTLKDSLREAIELERLKFYQQLNTLKQSYPNTYVTHAVIDLLQKRSRYADEGLKQAYETEPAMLNRYYFDGVEINDVAYLGHPLFFQSVNEYISEYAGERPDEWSASIDYMMGHITDTLIRKTVADYLVFHYLDRNLDDLAQEIALTYIPGCSDDYIAQLKKTDRYRAGPQLHARIPTMSLPDGNGKVVDVDAIIANNQITLIYFWKSTCSFCNEEHAFIKRIHEIYADKGLAIVGVSLDIDKQAWLSAISEHQLAWLNLTDLKGVSSPAIYDFAIASTPSTFVVNNKGILLAKDLKGRNLQDFFLAYFNAQN